LADYNFHCRILTIRFWYEILKDRIELSKQPINEKFGHLCDFINQTVFNGEGQVSVNARNEFNMLAKGGNQIIYFIYGAGILTVVWKINLGFKEIIHKERFSNARTLSQQDQEVVGKRLIQSVSRKISMAFQ
jgi:hypothetical protein